MRTFRPAWPLVVLFAWLLAACGVPANGGDGRLRVVATTSVLGDVVANLGGDWIELSTLIPPETDPHSFEAAPRDVATVADADLLVVNGLGLETFLAPLLDNAGDGPQVVVASDGVDALQSSEDQHADEGELDPHVWLDPQNVIIWTENIAATLSAADPEHATDYAANAQAYIAQLQDLDAWMVAQLAAIPAGQRELVTDHDAFAYFAERFDFKVVGVIIPSVSTLASPSAQQLADLQDTLAAHPVPAIFIETSTNPDLAGQLAQDLGVELVPLYVGSLSAAGGPAPTYMALMHQIVDQLTAALK